VGNEGHPWFIVVGGFVGIAGVVVSSAAGLSPELVGLLGIVCFAVAAISTLAILDRWQF
jgi:hypothetical protein